MEAVSTVSIKLEWDLLHFFKLCKILAEHDLLQETTHMSIREQVLSFLHIIGA